MKKTAYKGLLNIGNTCYFNSILQTLIHTPLKILTKRPYKGICNTYFFFEKDYVECDKFTNPNKLKYHLDVVCPHFRGSYQHDAHECLIFLLERLHKDSCYTADVNIGGEVKTKEQEMQMKSLSSWKDTIKNTGYSNIFYLFYSQLMKKNTCNTCNITYIKFETNVGFSLPLPKLKEEKETFKLEDLLKEYFKSEEIFLDCDNCNSKKSFCVNTSVSLSPPIIFFHICRFNAKNKKLDDCVNAPKELVINKEKYSLYSIINHSGGTKSGHYYNYSNLDGSWVEMNDTKLTNITNYSSPDNYIFFYIKNRFFF
jgi:ubiquitin C-terminal hydrolase